MTSRGGSSHGPNDKPGPNDGPGDSVGINPNKGGFSFNNISESISKIVGNVILLLSSIALFSWFFSLDTGTQIVLFLFLMIILGVMGAMAYFYFSSKKEGKSKE